VENIVSTGNASCYVTYCIFILVIYVFCHTKNIMKKVKEKIERMDLTMARKPKGNCEAYIN